MTEALYLLYRARWRIMPIKGEREENVNVTTQRRTNPVYCRNAAYARSTLPYLALRVPLFGYQEGGGELKRKS